MDDKGIGYILKRDDTWCFEGLHPYTKDNQYIFRSQKIVKFDPKMKHNLKRSSTEQELRSSSSNRTAPILHGKGIADKVLMK